MQELCTAIEAAYTVSGGATARGLLNELYYEMQPDQCAMPFARYNIVSNDVDRAFGGVELRIIELQFSVFDDSPDKSACGSMIDAITALYDAATLSVSGWTVISFLRSANGVLRDGGGWHGMARYRAILQKT